ncbi:MAG TPA: hypothetical protein VMT85_16295 [Thermoanaerobaculia bacterium]|nr:hypothetical protein [Thermoanaerobaculia bacterium]
MIASSTLGKRLRAARRTGDEPLATRNRLFVARACFCLAGASVVAAIGAVVDELGVLPPLGRILLVAVGASLLGVVAGAIELARSGGSRDVWLSIGLNLMALIAALLVY